jgi:hypothetical protein
MRRFLFSYVVESASGSQTFYVDAETPEDALALLKTEGGELYRHEVEVTDLSEPEPSGETTLDDFGDYEPASLPPEQEAPAEREAVLAEALEQLERYEYASATLLLRKAMAMPLPPEQGAQQPVSMDDAIAAGDGTLHGAIDHWQRRALAAEQAAQQEPPPNSSETPNGSQEPATSTEQEPMTAERAAFFLRRFEHDEKMLGPNEQRALGFAIAALAQPPAASQEPSEDDPTWVLLIRPGMAPVRKGPFYDDKHTEQMLRGLYELHADATCIVIDMPHTSYPQSGHEWLGMVSAAHLGDSVGADGKRPAAAADGISERASDALDAKRLDWMSSREAWIGWNREGDMCRVWRRGEDEDDFRPEPVCGWSTFFDDHRAAIDAAMANGSAASGGGGQ